MKITGKSGYLCFFNQRKSLNMKSLRLFCQTSFVALILITGGCNLTSSDPSSAPLETTTADTIKSVFSNHTSTDTPLEKRLREQGLVDIAQMDSSIAVRLVYATPYNFVGKRLYTGLNKAFILPQAAQMLLDAKQRLKALRPDLNLLVYDAARPLSVQQQMWDMVKGTEMRDFVANPNNGPGMHNFGAAIDLTLMDCTGQPLPMGSGFDYFGDESRTTDEQTLVDEGRITPRELENRLLLRRVMTEAGFTTITEEWWHFNIMPTEKARKILTPIE